MARLKNVEPVVRSIRIAATLNERFGAILREAASYQKVAEFELKIGEAQQIYPEIWRHLDEARAGLGQRGTVVPSYGVLRMTERSGEVLIAAADAVARGLDPQSTVSSLSSMRHAALSFNS